MTTDKIKLSELFDYWVRVRDHFDIAVRIIPADKLEWKPKDAVNSFGDIIRHAIETAYWVLAAINGRPEKYNRCDSKSFPDKNSLIIALDKNRLQLFTMLSNLTLDDLKRTVTLSGNEDSTLKWLVFHLFEHDIHHRSQIFLYLRMLGINPPKI